MGRKSGGTQRVQQESTVTQKSFPDELMPYMRKSLQMADALMTRLDLDVVAKVRQDIVNKETHKTEVTH